MGFERLSYDQFRDALKRERLPCALVNLDAFDANVEKIVAPARDADKYLRIASKSIRVPHLMKYVHKQAPETCRGIMAYTVEEAAYLAMEHGFDNLLVAYPSVQASDLEALASAIKAGRNISIIIDSTVHLDALSTEGEKHGIKLLAVLELDVSYRPMSGLVHLGVRRSPVRDADAALELFRYAQKLKGVSIVGVMAYEAHIAGLTDKNPFQKKLNLIAKIVKKLSVKDVARKRAELFDKLKAEGFGLNFINGGGTGSLDTTTKENAVTEVTAGSGFYCPHLFSYYESLDLMPSAFFAIQVVRVSDKGFVTCHGGGYIASGAVGMDKAPVPYSPSQVKLVGAEGTGEVQTPLRLLDGCPKLNLGDPVIFRHSKAGELMEHFNEVLLIREGKIVDRVPTYRGLGKSFL